jgi:hypothetical protein
MNILAFAHYDGTRRELFPLFRQEFALPSSRFPIYTQKTHKKGAGGFRGTGQFE